MHLELERFETSLYSCHKQVSSETSLNDINLNYNERVSWKEALSSRELTEAFQFLKFIYIQEGRISDYSIADSFSIETDERKIFNFYKNGSVIATFCVHIPTDQHSYVEPLDKVSGELPKCLKQKKDIICISKLAIAREFRGTLVIKKVFQLIHKLLVESNRNTIVLSCSDSLVPKYKKILFKNTNLTYVRPYGRKDTLHLMYSTQKKLGTYGLHAGPIRWNIFLGEIYNDMEVRYNFNLIQKSVFWFYKLFYPLSTYLEIQMNKRKR